MSVVNEFGHTLRKYITPRCRLKIFCLPEILTRHWFFGITRRDLRKLAYDVAERNGIAHSFSNKEQLVGWDWVKGFQSRHPIISLRIPEVTSAARARGFNKVVVSKHFENLSLVMDKYKFEPSRIWNVDESGLTTVPSKNSKIFATKGRKQVGVLTSAENLIEHFHHSKK